MTSDLASDVTTARQAQTNTPREGGSAWFADARRACLDDRVLEWVSGHGSRVPCSVALMPRYRGGTRTTGSDTSMPDLRSKAAAHEKEQR
jgi:hypothetical protein